MAASTVNNLRRIRNTREGGGIITRIWSAAAAANFRRGGHTSSGYEKNVEEQVRPTVVPDHHQVVIEEASSTDNNKYWAPHPYTGVFGPAGGVTGAAGLTNKEDHQQQLQINDDESSEKAWFRPTSLEDLEKPPTHQY